MDGISKAKAPENYKREIAFILFKRTRLIVLTALTIFLAAIAILLYWPPTYGAYGSVILKSRKIDRDPTVLENTELRSGPVTDNDTYSELSIITSDELFSLTLATLAKAGQTDALEALHEDPAKRTSALRQALSARVVPTTTVIEVSLAGGDPDITLTTLNALFDTYFAFRHRVYAPGGEQELIGQRVERMRAQLEQRNRQTADFLANAGLSLADQQIQSNLHLRSQLGAELLTLDRSIADMKGENGYLNELLGSRDVQMLASVHLAGGVLLSGRADIASYLMQNEARLAVADAHRTEIARQIAELERQNQNLRRNQLTFETMLQETAVMQQTYQTLLTRYAEAQMESQSFDDASNPYVAYLVPPRLMPDVLFPKAGLVLPVGLVAAVLLGISLAFVKESLDHTFARPEDMEKALGVPVLLSIPAGGIRRGRRATAAATAAARPAPAWRMRPRFLWLRRAAQLALVAVLLWAVGLIARGEWPMGLVSVTHQPEAAAQDYLATIPDTGEVRQRRAPP